MTARLWDIGRDLQSRVKSFFDTPLGPSSSPLELLHAALDELERKVQPSGRGARTFPYNRIMIHVAQPGADRAAVEAVFRQLESRLRERLAELRCDPQSAIEARVSFVDPREQGQPILSVECVYDAAMEPSQAPEARVDAARPVLRITVLKGKSEQPEYAFDEPMVAVGRTADPVDAEGNVRRNHVVFEDRRDGVTETVARAHARFRFDAESGAFLLFNESSSNPTAILRGGRSIRVPPREPRGLRVQSGDEIQLGRAVIRVTIG